ncbi:hypothetical protein BJ138DRAFT_1105003 [Hygrophoropsis aurantiaca]|uniref:Uncharacterized protein n=1 Tax=Hygrophoropsis aurantiaca TaxID=72124 RepID=A0ACB7ZZW6_9AGAM|nr:hypothetical protein BJ138DRAFT_1105003 [Hygrophoropsis aurantiaca]
MLYHRTHAAPTRLLAVFARTFVPVGVPGRSVRAILRRERQRQAHAKGHHVSQATGHADQAHPAQVTAHPARVTNLQQREPKIQQGGLTPSPHANLLPPAPLPLKLWPGPAHTALVWEAVVWGTHPRGVGSLYAALVRGVSGDEGLRGASPSGSRTSGGATSSERGALAQGEEDGQQGEEWEWEDVESHLNTASDAGGKGKGRSGLEVPRHTYDAAHFSPFVKAFAKRPWVYANVPSAVGSVDASSAPYNGASSTDASSSDLPSAPGPDTPSAPGPDTPSAPGSDTPDPLPGTNAHLAGIDALDLNATPALRVLADMRALGIEPGVRQWSMALRGLAEFGVARGGSLRGDKGQRRGGRGKEGADGGDEGARLVWEILGVLEGEAPTTSTSSSSSIPACPAPTLLPTQTLTTTQPLTNLALYTNLLRGFVFARRLADARRVREVVLGRWGVVLGAQGGGEGDIQGGMRGGMQRETQGGVEGGSPEEGISPRATWDALRLLEALERRVEGSRTRARS